jgi:hypothetical protein
VQVAEGAGEVDVYMNIEKAFYDLTDSISVIRDCVKLFKEGANHFYRPVAVELRMLFCDGKNPLIKKLFPNLLLHRLNGYYRIDELNEQAWNKYKAQLNKNNLYLRGTLHAGSPERIIEKLFDPQKQDLALVEWINQPFFDDEITINEFIRHIADKLVAHSDNKYSAVINKIRSGTINNSEVHENYIVSIGDYVIKLITPLTTDNPYCNYDTPRVKGFYCGKRIK